MSPIISAARAYDAEDEEEYDKDEIEDDEDYDDDYYDSIDGEDGK